MRLRALGKTDIKISEVGLGTWELSGDVYGKKDDKESIRAIHTALELGVNFIDTAAGYGKGHVEDLIADALEKKPTDVIISTKIKPECGIYAPSPDKPIKDFFSPEYIIAKTEESLKRLKRDYIDILFLHTWSRSWGHETAWAETLSKLKSQGKIRAFGISIPDEGIADANVHIEADRLDVIQCAYNIFQQEPEYSLFPLAEKHDIGIIARSPFSSGVLVGNWTKDMQFEDGDWRGIWPKSVKDNWLEEQVAMAEEVKKLLADAEIPIPQGSIKYILMNQAVTSVIPGSSNPEHVKSNISSANLRDISKEMIQKIHKLWTEEKIHGTYNGSI